MYLTALTIFPDMFVPFWNHGIVRRAVAAGIIQPVTVDIRDFAEGPHRVTDDRPFGGGSGMVMKPEPLAAAIRHARALCPDALRVMMSPQGRVFDQHVAADLAGEKGLILVSGRYEGVDERLVDDQIDLELSIGDYVLSGGELAAMIVMDAVVRLIPGALGGEKAAERDSFSDGLLEHAQYTRPRLFEGSAVPEILVSGHHGIIDRWRRETSLIRTLLKRSDLLEGRQLTREQVEWLRHWSRTIERILQAQDLSGAGTSSGR
ncbi:MAG: tRNA (guanosine(37)-N1)-methyltransferase TrmD [Desulfobacterales bacterium]